MKKEQNKEADNKDAYMIECLKDPMLLDRIVLDGLDNVIVGEENARRCIFICAMGSMVTNARRTSYNLVVNSDSGAGKDHIVDSVLKVLPPTRVLKRTRISPTALTYWHDSRLEPSWSWDGKILYLEDCNNDIFNSDVFKVFTSGGSYATIVKDQKAVDIKIVGKPVVIITSASSNPEAELLRRFMVINLNETKEQTREVMHKWADHAAKGYVPDSESDYSKALLYLEPGAVKVPWADRVVNLINGEHIHMRTHFSRFMDLIKASCVLHQYQREKDCDDYFIANSQDYNIARKILLATSGNKFMLPLTKNQKDTISTLKDLGWNVTGEGLNERKIGWTVNELLARMPFSKTQLYRELNKLSNLGFINKEPYRFEYDRKSSILYSYKEQDEMTLPTWEELGVKEEEPLFIN